MQVRKAVITAAGRGARQFPAATPVHKAMLPLVDSDGVAKPVIQIIAEEALSSGIEALCVVCAPGDPEQYVAQFKALRSNLLAVYEGMDWAERQAERIDEILSKTTFVVQDQPKGYGHAVYCARSFTGDDPFLLMLGDHLYVSDAPGTRCARQLLEVAAAEAGPVAALHATREHLIGRYGTVRASRDSNHPDLYQLETILEKPSITTAERELQTPGLRAGFYQCFFGMHVLTATAMALLEAHVNGDEAGSADVQLTPVLQELARRERYLGLEVRGRRYDVGAKFGMLQAQIALSMAGDDREHVLATLIEALAESGAARLGS